ncbi:TolC family protein [candidate division WOR-3 bacterium]|nr:TolC family protein [candidate division WOR-3 bacterium]
MWNHIVRRGWASVSICILLLYSYPLRADSTLNDTLTLTECIEIALNNSPDLRIARNNLRVAELNLQDMKTAIAPTIQLSGSYDLNNVYNRLEWTPNHYNLGINATLTPFNSGRNLINIAQARNSLAIQRQIYRNTEQTVILNLIRKYFNLLKSQAMLKLYEENLTQKKQQLELARTRFELGLAPKSDVLKAEVEVTRAEVDLTQAKGQLELARMELNDALGIDLDYPIKIKQVESIEEQPPSIDSCIAIALKERPDLLRAQSDIMSNVYNLKLAWLERLPYLTITGSYHLTADRFVFDGIPVTRTNLNRYSDWSISLGLSFPIFDAGKTWHAIKMASLYLDNSRLEYDKLKRSAILEVQLAYVDMVTGLKKIELTRKQLKAAQLSYDIALGRYRAGIAPITEVIDASITLLDSKLSYTNAIYDYLIAKSRLAVAMGQLPYKLED